VRRAAELGGRFDLILIDGRFRRRCLLAAKEAATPEGLVLLHDAQRLHYHASMTSYPHQVLLATGRLHGSRSPAHLWAGSTGNAALIADLATQWGPAVGEIRA
jgi:hypothetical protein